jgi:hypothetical protein
VGENIKYHFDEHVTEDTKIGEKVTCRRFRSGYICAAT